MESSWITSHRFDGKILQFCDKDGLRVHYYYYYDDYYYYYYYHYYWTRRSNTSNRGNCKDDSTVLSFITVLISEPGRSTKCQWFRFHAQSSEFVMFLVVRVGVRCC